MTFEKQHEYFIMKHCKDVFVDCGCFVAAGKLTGYLESISAVREYKERVDTVCDYLCADARKLSEIVRNIETFLQ